MADKKLAIVQRIFDNRELLFCQPSNLVNMAEKTRIWTAIADEADDQSCARDFKHLRDTSWKNWRRRAIEKKNAIAGSGDSSKDPPELNESDKLILDILEGSSRSTYVTQPQTAGSTYFSEDDDDSSAPDGGGGDGIGGAREDADDEDDINYNVINQNKRSIFVKKESVDKSGAENGRDDRRVSEKRKRRKRAKNEPIVTIRERFLPSAVGQNDDDDLETLQKKKLKYETILLAKNIEIAQRESYKLDLELHKLEVSLNRPPSQFTRRFFDPLND